MPARGGAGSRRTCEPRSRIVARMDWFRLAVLLIAAARRRLRPGDGLRAAAALPADARRCCMPRGRRSAKSASRRPRSAGRACASTMRRASRARCGASHFVACGFGGDHVRARPARSRGGRDRRAARSARRGCSSSSASGRGRARGRAGRASGAAGTPGGRGLCAAAAGQRARARGGLRAARDRLFADLRAGRADQSRVRRDRGARRLRGDRRRRGGGRARHRRPDRGPRARARDRGGDLGRLEHAGRPRWWSRRCTRATGSASRS